MAFFCPEFAASFSRAAIRLLSVHPEVYGESTWSFASYAIMCALLKPAVWAAPRLT
ncbi:hypothetical protein KOSB73_220652 [Klebsiella grimontii]|uniref:Uncharacterized protein n=1 Tax=Klebsiella grimontii TaxID=2058152 RepID=A0A285B126_9ENTR|nr:hypothetical protein KOSB73_220652 [Klebsiella grimontii]